MKSYQRPQMKALCTVCADSVCMMYRSIPAATYVVRVGRREGDYGVDNVHESEMRVHHVDLVSSCKGEMVHFFQCPRFFYIKFHVFCVVLEVENLLKPGKNICCVEHNWTKGNRSKTTRDVVLDDGRPVMSSLNSWLQGYLKFIRLQHEVSWLVNITGDIY